MIISLSEHFHVYFTEVCYLSKGPLVSDQRRCATERVEAVTGLDIMYSDFQEKTMGSMEASDRRIDRSCGKLYDCPDGEPDCSTRYKSTLKCLSIWASKNH